MIRNKHIVLTLVFIILLSAKILANEKKNVIAINPIGFFLDIQNFEFESSVGKKTSISLYLSRTGYVEPEIEGIQTRIAEERITYRHYFFEPCLKGSWVGLNLAYISGDIWDPEIPTNYIYNTSMIVPGIETGYRLLIGSFNTSLYFIMRYKVTDNFLGKKQKKGDIEDLIYSLGWGITMGWLW